MGIGERLKMARVSVGMSQQELGKQVGVSRMSISKYENGLMTPRSDVLICLARVLGVTVEFLMRPVCVRMTPASYRRHPALPEREEGKVLARVQDLLERYLDLEGLFEDAPEFALSPDLDRSVASVEDVERVAVGLRHAWHLGLDPIDSLVEVLEEVGIKVGIVQGHDLFDALTAWANDDTPVIIVKEGLPGDRERFSLAHELGHLVMDLAPGVDAESAAQRFAGAFLVPQPTAERELGHHRGTLSLHELHLLKHKYGLSMQAWIHRAGELGIISDALMRRLLAQFKTKGWDREEPGDQVPFEEPDRMRRLALRALAEDVISPARFEELMAVPWIQFWKEEAERHGEFPDSLHS